MNQKKLKVGIAGFGVVGNRRKHYIDLNPHMEVVAVCDQRFSENKTDDHGILCYQEYRSLLENNLDVIFVCMSNDMAAEVTIASLESGKHVFCEKPPARSLEEMNHVIKAEKENSQLKLMYGFNHRYHDSVKEALRILESGSLGKVINIKGVYGKAKLITFNQPDWRTKRELSGGGVLLDQGIHMVDLMLLFGKDFDSVHSFVSNNHWKYNVEDNAYAIMQSKSGVVAMLHSSATQWRHKFNLEINLEKGSLILSGILSGTKSYGSETLTVLHADPDNDSGDPREILHKYNKDPSWAEEIDIFADAIINGGDILSGNSLDAFKSLRLVFQIYYNDPSWRETWNIEKP